MEKRTIVVKRGEELLITFENKGNTLGVRFFEDGHVAWHVDATTGGAMYFDDPPKHLTVDSECPWCYQPLPKAEEPVDLKLKGGREGTYE